MKAMTFSILIVEDDADDRFFLDAAFVQIGYENEIKKFISGEYLFRYLEKIERSQYPSLIVLDNSLPKLDATDILSLLKNNPSYKNVPVVIYTGHLSPSKKQQLLELGAYTCLEKGITIMEIDSIARTLRDMAESNSIRNTSDVKLKI